jgi:hypothetical protein|tara:strand:+ start:7066 stop:9783 length:2718 start_codon:yes stop_codon:yes gene_type:complete
MANNRYTRSKVKDTVLRDTGPYEAIIVSHLDPLYMGTLEVELVKYDGSSGTPERSGQLVNVRYLSPFYGVTPSKGLTPNDGYQYTQKSYGMWAVPPDVGTRVLVMFAEGSAAYGYWIGCVQDVGMNFMIPDGRAVTENTTAHTPSNLQGTKLPVGEYNKLIETGAKLDPTLFEKPYNKDFAELLEVQGLILDEARGTTTTSARRETPSMVFGISTPGPLDKRNGNPKVKYGTSTGAADVPFNRLGGSSFVMDDGDDKFTRSTHPADGPPVYINREAGEGGGDETIPQNELMRFRTRTGHQILLHNSEDLIYIANSRGTAWIELSSDGKIDIYSKDSMSVFSDNDINFTANRDFNVEAGRNINMKASARYSDGKSVTNDRESGRIQLESAFNTNINVGSDYKLTVADNSDTVVNKIKRTTVENDYHLQSNSSIYQKSKLATHHAAGHSFYRRSDANIYDIATEKYYQTASGLEIRAQTGDIKSFVAANVETMIGGWRHESVTGESHLTSAANIRHQSATDYTVISATTINNIATGNVNIKSSASIFTDAASALNIKSGAALSILSGAALSIDGAAIGLNDGGSADPASNEGDVPIVALEAVVSNPATDPEPATPVVPLELVTLPYILPGAQTAVEFESILTRAPQHEPWPHHENANPYAFKPEETDREMPGHLPLNDRVLTVDTFRKNMDGVATSNYVTSNAYSQGSFTGSTGDGYIVQDTARGSTTTTAPVYNSNGTDGPLKEIRTSINGITAQVAEVFAEDYQGFIDELEAAGYEIKKLGGYSKRRTVSGTRWSVHASGGAIDINWPAQVMGGRPNGFFKPRPANAPITDMPVDIVRALCSKYGLGWGGDWRSLDDAMHFSKAKNEGGAVDGLRDGKIPMPVATIQPHQGQSQDVDAGGYGNQE